MFSKILAAFSAIALTPLLLSAQMGEKKKDKEPVCESPFHAMHVGVRHTESKGVGYKEGYTTLEGFGIYDGWPSFMPFLDLRGHVFNSGKLAGNVGIGERSVIPSIDHIFGLYLYYDTRQSDHGLKVNQLSPGLELLGERMEYRVNGYFPVGKHKGHRYDSEFNSFSGNQVILQSKRKYAMSGWDGEVGVHLTQSTRNDFYLGAGPYYFTSDPSSAWGGKARIYWRFKEYVSLEASYTYDHLFKSIVQGTATVSYPFGPKLKRKGTGCPNPDDLGLSRAAFAPYRFEIPVIRKHKPKDPAINPATGQPWQVWFVNNTSSSNGTFESPFPTLVQAQNASGPNDMIYVFPGNGTTKGMDQGIVLKNAQKLFGSGIDQTIATTEGTIVLPAQSSTLPNVTNVSGAGNVVQLANLNEVSGFNLNTSVASSATVFGNEVVGGSIHNNNFTGTVDHSSIGVSASGLFSIENNTFTDTVTATAGIALLVDKTNTLIARITGNTSVGYAVPMSIGIQGSATGIFEIENNNINNTAVAGIAGILFQGSFASPGKSLQATIVNNQLTNREAGIFFDDSCPTNTCVVITNNSINKSGPIEAAITLTAPVTPNSSLVATLMNNEILNSTLGVSVAATAGSTVCLEMANNTAPSGFLLLSGAIGATFNVGPLENNIGPFFILDGPINEVESCIPCSGQ